MLDEIAKGNRFGDLNGALDLIYDRYALGFQRFSDIENRLRPAAAENIIVVTGGMNGMQLERRIAKPVSEFGNLGLILIVDMLAGTENFHAIKAGIPDSFKPRGRETLADQEMCRQYLLHCVLFYGVVQPALVTSYLSIEARFRTTFEQAIVDNNRFHSCYAAHRFDFVAHGAQRFGRLRRKTVL